MNGIVPRGIMATRESEVTEVNTVGAVLVAKKKGDGERKTLPVRIDAHLVRRAQNVAKDQGVPLSEYLTEVIRGAVDRDWAKIIRRLAKEEGQ
jgi:hypothetical protein